MLKKPKIIGWIFLLPFVLHFSLFVIYPLICTIFYSLTDYNLLTMQKNFIGINNFKNILQDDIFIKALSNTAFYVLIDGTGVVLFGLIMALALNLKLKGIGVFRTIYYLPVAVDWVIVSIVFMFILNPTFGVANYFLRLIGIPPQKYLEDPSQALLIITLLSIWKGVGYYAVFYLAALQDVSETLLEAASIDGANTWQKFIHVTLPQIAPVSLFVIIMASIGSLKGFDQFYIMTAGGPARATTTIMLYFYENAFGYAEIGYGSAVAIFFTVVVFAFVGIQRLLLSRMRGISND